jgi:hypothetical protein
MGLVLLILAAQNNNKTLLPVGNYTVTFIEIKADALSEI